MGFVVLARTLVVMVFVVLERIVQLVIALMAWLVITVFVKPHKRLLIKVSSFFSWSFQLLNLVL